MPNDKKSALYAFFDFDVSQTMFGNFLKTRATQCISIAVMNCYTKEILGVVNRSVRNSVEALYAGTTNQLAC